MIYKQFKELQVSTLALGAMRLPTLGAHNAIDEKAVEEMVAYAMEKGINYYDTAWGYHDGESENVIGRVLKKYPRDKFYLATKFPGYDVANLVRVKEIFERQLEKCQVEYFDFYLFHNVCESNVDGYLDPKYGIYDYLMEQKRNGRIKHLGFSAHGSYEVIKRFLEAYGKDMEFCQLQINYLDWEFQNAKEKVELVSSYGIPVWVMEPARGGRLAVLEDEYMNRLKAFRPEESAPAWAFRFIQSIPEVVVTLSGMSNFEQLKANIETFSEEKPLSEEEMTSVLQMARDMTGRIALPCTSCRYCTTHCPKGLDIPALIKMYNEHVFTGGGFLAPMLLGTYDEEKRPSACIGCRACERVCPQGIRVATMMKDFNERLKKED